MDKVMKNKKSFNEFSRQTRCESMYLKLEIHGNGAVFDVSACRDESVCYATGMVTTAVLLRQGVRQFAH